MTTLGNAILVAARDQGWTVAYYGRFVALISPDGSGYFQAPVELLEHDRYEPGLRFFLLHLIVEGGLHWPWPPDHWDDVHGETHRHD